LALILSSFRVRRIIGGDVRGHEEKIRLFASFGK